MRAFLKWAGLAGAVLVLAGAGFFFFILPPRVDDAMNVVTPHAPYVISPEGRALHDSLRVADLHSDLLLWSRDPVRRYGRGHTDLPRLREGGVVLQVFTSVTKTPSNMNYETNEATSDDITLLAIAQRWPVDTWGSLYNRARFHARRLHRAEERSGGDFVVVESRADLEAALEAHETNPDLVAGILGTEGAHPLEGDLANIPGLYEEGYRVIGLQHFFDNELGGSLHGVSNAGLTDFGRAAVQDMLDRGFIIDVAHSSEAVVREVLDMTDAPLIISHTGVRSLCETPRNISDDLLNRIAARGGLIGIGFWADVTCDDSPQGIAWAIQHAVNLFGVEAVALGSDYDGTITATLDASELAALTDALLATGMDADEVRAVMGENQIRFFLENLPEE
ncbi:membrane dipeptidase [Hyphobacterium sp. HN65]|uniref:Membrane dipeptidase n=1 Tax=Hyphobacterium lacteum TaxID=3116575 RepID=A0ABU7LRK1_9PROT|nr:membrane dipeptidase [Hyphobacterium sp. HN65]MEE2526541.1 membrane dipeptidase [Hyphobacterium sp. HN65]